MRGRLMFLFSLLLVWIVWITVYTFFFSEYNVPGKSIYEKMMSIYTSYYFFPSIMPFMLLLFSRRTCVDMRYFVRLMTLLSLIYVIIYPFAFYNMLNYQYDQTAAWGDEGGYGDFINNSNYHIPLLAVPAILYYFRRYIPNKLWWLFFAVSIGELLIGLYTARRGRTVTFLLYYVLCFLLYYFNKNTSKIQMLIAGVLVLYLGYLIVMGSSGGFLSLLIERGVADSRTEVENSFYASMDVRSWIWGRGWFGQYYDYIFKDYRSSIETGYLALILRGGIIYLILYVFIFLYSGIRGLFFSNSVFVKAFAIMLLMNIFELYPWGWPLFNFKFFVMWIGVYICNNPFYLSLNDKKVKTIFAINN